MEISHYHDSDAREVTALFYAAVHAIDEAVYSGAQKAAWAPWPADHASWRHRLAGKKPYLARIDGRLAGFMELDPDGHIDCAYVHPDFQGRGVASALYRHLEAVATGQGLGRLYVEASEVALPFFRRMGFVLLGRNQLQRGGVALHNYRMEKSLSHR